MIVDFIKAFTFVVGSEEIIDSIDVLEHIAHLREILWCDICSDLLIPGALLGIHNVAIGPCYIPSQSYKTC